MEPITVVQSAERSIVEMGVSSRRRLLSSLIVPFIVLIGVPLVIFFLTGTSNGGWAQDPPQSVIVSFSGLVLVVLGLILFVATVRLFSQHGEGSIMPWDPTQRLIVQGVYRHVRNPMHTGVFLVLFGEGLLLRSIPLLVLVAAVVVLHLFYIPRLTPWEPGPQKRDREQ
jgi:protein-S-isoprenylcysteine O-methyltransferase Ste14